MRGQSIYFLFIILLVLTLKASGQTFSVKAGLNLSNIRGGPQETLNTAVSPGIQLGGVVEFPMSNVFLIQTGLQFMQKGYAYTLNKYYFYYDFLNPIHGEMLPTTFANIDRLNVKMNLYYLELPLLARANFKLGNLKMYGALGPYFALGLWGKAHAKTYYSDGDKEKISKEIPWGGEGERNRFDYGLEAELGMNISHFLGGLSYSYGFKNIIDKDNYSYSTSNWVFSIFAGYRLGK